MRVKRSKRVLVVAMLVGISTFFTEISRAYATDSGSNVSEEEYQVAVDRLNILASRINDLKSQIDKSQFDPDSSLEDLDYDAELIIQFVKDKISFEPYPGLLRGAAGTLMSRAGNSLDQSVLLAKLLKDVGYDARIAQGKLSEDLAEKLVSQLSRTANIDSPFRNDDEAVAIFVKMAKSAGLSEPVARQLVAPPEKSLLLHDTLEYQDTESVTEVLTRELLASGKYDLDSTLDKLIRDETREYFWVEFRSGVTDSWESVHVAFQGDTLNEELSRLKPERVFANEVPSELQHRVRFTAFVEQRLGSKVVDHIIAGPYEKPAANLAGVPIEFSIVPFDLFANEEMTHDSFSKAMESSVLFASILSDGSAAITAYFDLNGNAVDPMAGSNSAAAVFQSVGNRFGRAAGSLAGEENPDDFVRLNRVWIQYDLIAPGGAVTSYRRTLYDGTQLPAESNAGIGKRIAQTLTFMTMSSTVPPGLIMDMNLDKIASAIPVYKLAITPDSPLKSSAMSPNNPDLKNLKSQWIGHLQLFSVFDRGYEYFADNAHSYRSGTNILAYQEYLDFANPEVAIDVVSNERRSFLIEQDGAKFSKKLMMQVGVWETRLEGLLTQGLDGKGFNTFVAIDNAKSRGIDLVVVEPGNERALANIGMSPTALANAERDLRNGYLLLVPRAMAGDSTMTGWWRVNQLTGQTLGMGGDGRGVAITESMANRVVAATVVTGAACFAYMTYNRASGMATIVQCGKLAFTMGGATAATVLAIAAAAEAAAAGTVAAAVGSPAHVWAVGGQVMLWGMALLEILSLDPSQ